MGADLGFLEGWLFVAAAIAAVAMAAGYPDSATVCLSAMACLYVLDVFHSR